MAKFIPGTDTQVKTNEPRLEVLASASASLPPGKHVFQLIVTDDAGNDSGTASVTVIVQDTQRPTAVIDLLNPDGSRNPAPVVSVPFGTPFQLTGDRSSDIGGEVKLWQWTLLQG